MALVKAICPACKQQIEVDSAETVDFCKLCGKPVDTQTAIELYTDSVAERQKQKENSRKPAQKVIDKFNAILAQDCKLAQYYLEELLKKEYDGLYYKRIYMEQVLDELDSALSVNYYDEKRKRLDKISKEFENLSAINPSIGEMYRKLLCGYINEFVKTKANVTFTGELPYLKKVYWDINGRLDSVFNAIGTSNKLDLSIAWGKLYCDTFSIYYPEQGTDDEFIFYLIENIYRYEHSTKIKENRYSTEHVVCGYYIATHIAINKNEYRAKNLDDIAKRLAEFLSPDGKKKFEKMSQEHERQLQDEWENIYNVELPFWQEYVTLLKKGKIKEAYGYIMNSVNKQYPYSYEISLFQKGLFGMKYKGHIASLDSEKEARSATNQRLMYGNLPAQQK